MKKWPWLVLICFFTVYKGSAQNAGIGLPNPVHARLEINGSVGAAVGMFGSDKFGLTIEADNPEVGFNYYYSGGTRTIRAGYAAYLGMYPASGDLYIGTFDGNQSATNFGTITGAREALRIKQNGFIGIAIDPSFPLTVRSNGTAGGLVQESPDGTSQVGFYTGFSAAYLQTWTNTNLNFATGNGVSRMVLSTTGVFTINKSLNLGVALRSSSTGASNLLPIAYGRVDESGNIVFATINFFVSHPTTGQYQVTLFGEDINANANKYTIMLTPGTANENINVFARNWANYSIQGGAINVYTGFMTVNAQQVTSCGCGASYINSSLPAVPGNCPFDITIYKNN